MDAKSSQIEWIVQYFHTLGTMSVTVAEHCNCYSLDKSCVGRAISLGLQKQGLQKTAPAFCERQVVMATKLHRIER